MNLDVGVKALITTDNWFYGPDGKQYRAVWGTIKTILNDEAQLGIKTNARSTNWYVEIGCMVIAGCQIHYAMRSDECELDPVDDWQAGPEGMKAFKRPSAIFNADR